MKYTIPVPTNLTKHKAEKLYELLRMKIADNHSNPEEILAELDILFYTLFAEIEKPISTGFRLKPKGLRLHEDLYNYFLDVSYDLGILYSSNQDLVKAAQASFNTNASNLSKIKGRVARVDSLSIDLQLTDRDLRSDIIIAGDDFTGYGRIDNKEISGSKCNIMLGGHGLTLERKGHADAINIDNVVVSVNRPDSSYEGRLFAPLGSAEPEGGTFHWTAVGGGEGTDENIPGYDIPVADIGTSTIVDNGASEEELAIVRKNVVDANAETYWQIEVTKQDESLTDFISELNEEDLKNQERGNYTSSAITLGTLQNLINRKKFDPLVISLIVDLKEEKPISWLSLVPITFYKGQYLEVLNIELAASDGIYKQIPHMGEHENESILTEEANAVLQPHEVKYLMTDSKAFAGTGLWAFPEVSARYIKFTLKQPKYYVNPYSTYRVTLETTITSTLSGRKKTEKYGKVTRRDFSESFAERVIVDLDLDYPRSILLHEGTDIKNIMRRVEGITLDEQQLKDLSKGGDFKWKSLVGTVCGHGFMGSALEDFEDVIMGNILTAINKIVNFFDKKVTYYNRTLTINSEDWVMTEKEEIPRYDTIRQAIGIRDIIVSKYTYTESSKATSQIFKTPKPIRKISLLSDEIIPQTLDQSKTWIRYWVSVKGSDWMEITPESPNVRYNKDSNYIPQIINVNSDEPEDIRSKIQGYIDVDDPDEIKVMIEIQRADDETVTPILKSYRLKLFCEGL